MNTQGALRFERRSVYLGAWHWRQIRKENCANMWSVSSLYWITVNNDTEPLLSQLI